MVDTKMEVILEMFFLTLNSADIWFVKVLVKKIYIVANN